MYAGNSGVYDGMIISALSASEYTEDAVHAFILTMDLTDENPKYTPITRENAEFIEKILKRKNSESKVTLIDVRDEYLKVFADSPNTENQYTPYTLTRLLADRLDGIPDKILYLDTDTVFLKSASEIYNIDVENYEFAAVRDYIGKFFFGFGYINAGVLLLNMKRIRESGLLSDAARMCAEKKIFLSDQSAINSCANQRLLLDRRYNEQKRADDNTVIRHFSMTIKWLPYFHTRNIKPWNVDAVKKNLGRHDYPRVKDILDKYLKIKNEINMIKEPEKESFTI